MADTAPKFPWRLHHVLAVAEANGQEAIISWLPSGCAFRVHDREAFVRGLMKSHFNQNTFKSFQRQLNLWGFQRIKNGRGAYHHPFFVKGFPEMCRLMIRVKVKGDHKDEERHALMEKYSRLVMSLSISSNPSH